VLDVESKSKCSFIACFYCAVERAYSSVALHEKECSALDGRSDRNQVSGHRILDGPVDFEMNSELSRLNFYRYTYCMGLTLVRFHRCSDMHNASDRKWNGRVHSILCHCLDA
jgi:hypothetical protein